MNKGFTLIELLVVVLIVGILSAVALPQYQKAVLKARSAPLLMWSEKLLESEEAYAMANGSYTHCLNLLDLDYKEAFPVVSGGDASCVTSVDGTEGENSFRLSTECGILKAVFLKGAYEKNGFGVYYSGVPAEQRKVGGLWGTCNGYGDNHGWRDVLAGMGYKNVVMPNYCCYQQVNL